MTGTGTDPFQRLYQAVEIQGLTPEQMFCMEALSGTSDSDGRTRYIMPRFHGFLPRVASRLSLKDHDDQ